MPTHHHVETIGAGILPACKIRRPELPSSVIPDKSRTRSVSCAQAASWPRRQIFIIGNGPVPHDISTKVNCADFVLRFNFLGSRGGNSGERTDAVAVCNTGRPGKAMLESAAWRAHPGLAQTGEIWCVRDGNHYRSMQDDVLRRHPELGDFFEDYTPGFAAMAAETNKTFRILGRQPHDLVVEALGDIEALSVVPSSGMIAIAHVLKNLEGGDRLCIAGFSHEGWELHPFAAERRLVDRWAAEGRLERA